MYMFLKFGNLFTVMVLCTRCFKQMFCERDCPADVAGGGRGGGLPEEPQPE